MTNKKNIIFLILVSILLSVFFVQESLAKYIASANETANMTIARWKILVNNEDIRNQSEVSATINPVFPGNDNIKENIIAPTSEGYFDLLIDAREADVSFKYKITFSPSPDSKVKDLIATKYIIDTNPEVLLTKDNQTIENTIIHKDNKDIIKIRVYILWNDAEGSTMTNKDDTDATLNNVIEPTPTPSPNQNEGNPPPETTNNIAKMDVKINFTQVV